MTKAPTIALAMIVKDEASTLPRCLDSARPWVDEIVVVDTGSTDATPDVARTRGACVISWAWRDDFAAARNESLRHATADWILVLDADEHLADGAGEALRHAVRTAPDDVVAWLVKIVCPRDGDGGLTRLNWFPRLFRNLPGVRFEGVIHEQIIGSLAGLGRMERAPVEVLHAGYARTPADMAAKAERNMRLLLRQLHDEPTYSPGWFQLAETHVLLGNLDAAVDAYRRCLRLMQHSRLGLPPGVIAVALQNLGAALLARGDREDGVRAIEAALDLVPDLAPAHVHLGNAAMARQDWAVAEGHFAEALDAAARAGDEGEYEISPWLIHFLRGCAFGRQERYAEARASFEAALALEPGHADSLWLLALMCSQARDWSACLAALDRLGALGRDDFAHRAQRAQALAALGRHAEALAAADAALALDGRSAPVLALAAVSARHVGRLADAAALAERLVDVAPGTLPPLLELAQCHENAGDFTRMCEVYQRALALEPGAPELLFALGSACLRAGAIDAAEECLAGAVAGRPDRADYRVSHALCLLRSGDGAQARRAFEEIAERWPGLPAARELADIADRLGGEPAGAGIS
jgi:tetratricopeptide (TPR) repeat protein